MLFIVIRNFYRDDNKATKPKVVFTGKKAHERCQGVEDISFLRIVVYYGPAPLRRRQDGGNLWTGCIQGFKALRAVT